MRTTTDGLVDLALETLASRRAQANEARRQVIDVAAPRNVPHDWTGPGAGEVAEVLGYAAACERAVGKAQAVLELAGADTSLPCQDEAAPEPRRSRR